MSNIISYDYDLTYRGYSYMKFYVNEIM